MNTRNRSGRTHAGLFVVLTVAAGGLVTLPLLGATDRDEAPAVDAGVLERALSDVVPGRPTMTDEIAYYEARVAARPDELFALERLFNAHQLAFRAYGDGDHLTRASELLARLSALGANDPATVRAAAALHLARHEFEEALITARALSGGGDVAAHRLFDALWAAGGRDEARALLERPLDRRSIAYLSRYARVLDADGLTSVARDRFRDVVSSTKAYAESVPVRAWALVELGNFELHSGDPAAAVARYVEALDVMPGSPAALEGLASVAYGVDGNLTAAAALYRIALRNGAHLDVQATLADIEEELGRPTEAEAIRRDFVAKATVDEATARMYRRPLVFVLADDESTRSEALRLARADLAARQDPGAFDALAWVLYRMGDVQLAWILEDRATAMGTPPPPLAFRAGIIAAAAGAHRDAQRLLRLALDGRVELAPGEVRAALAILG